MKARRFVVQAAVALASGAVLSFLIAETCAIRAGECVDAVVFERRTEDGGATWIDFYDPLQKVVLSPHVEEQAANLAEIAGLKTSSHAPFMRQQLMVMDGWGVTTERLSCSITEKGDRPRRGEWRIVTRSTAGWPFRCVVGFLVRDTRADSVMVNTTISAGPLQSAGRYDVPGAFLIYPLVAGAMLNSVFYATLLWIAACGVSMSRHHLRSRRNHCPSCNYDRKGLATGAPCPECGTVSPKVPVSDA